MSSLSDKLEEVTAPKKPTNIAIWLTSLSAEDRKLTWAALTNPVYRTHTLLRIFREEGGRFDKGSFVPFRNAVLAGEIKESDIHGS